MSKKVIRISESQIPKRLRGSRSIFLRKIARFGINIFGWTIKGEVPDEERIVIIAAPHTSNWDFILAMLAIFGLNIKVRWLGKHSIFKPGFKNFFNLIVCQIIIVIVCPTSIAPNYKNKTVYKKFFHLFFI